MIVGQWKWATEVKRITKKYYLTRLNKNDPFSAILLIYAKMIESSQMDFFKVESIANDCWTVKMSNSCQANTAEIRFHTFEPRLLFRIDSAHLCQNERIMSQLFLQRNKHQKWLLDRENEQLKSSEYRRNTVWIV